MWNLVGFAELNFCGFWNPLRGNFAGESCSYSQIWTKVQYTLWWFVFDIDLVHDL
jgi:hypothetical protein